LCYENENELLTTQLFDYKNSLRKAISLYNSRKISYDSILKNKSEFANKIPIPVLKNKISNLHSQNLHIMETIEILRNYAKNLIQNSPISSDFYQIISENENLLKILNAQNFNPSLKIQNSLKSPPIKCEIKPKYNTSPSRNLRKKHRVAHIRSLSLNANQWEDVFNSSPCKNNKNLISKSLKKLKDNTEKNEFEFEENNEENNEENIEGNNNILKMPFDNSNNDEKIEFCNEEPIENSNNIP